MGSSPGKMLSWWASWEGSVIWASQPHQLSNLCFLRFLVSYLALSPWRQELTRVCLYCNLHPLQQCLGYSSCSINILWVSKWVDGSMVCLSLWGQISGRLGPARLSVKWAPWPTHPGCWVTWEDGLVPLPGVSLMLEGWLLGLLPLSVVTRTLVAFPLTKKANSDFLMPLA